MSNKLQVVYVAPLLECYCESFFVEKPLETTLIETSSVRGSLRYSFNKREI